MVTPWIVDKRDPLPAEKIIMPAPEPVEVLLVMDVVPELIRMRIRSKTMMPPPLPKAPAMTSFTELLVKIQLFTVTRPGPPAASPEDALKAARPPPLPSRVALLSKVTLVSVRLDVPPVPVSNSMPPPSPSNPPTEPRFLPNLIVRLLNEAVALVMESMSSLTANTISTPFALVEPPWIIVVACPAPTILTESWIYRAPVSAVL